MSKLVNFQIPSRFKNLFVRGRWRNKVFHGGRGGAKSHNIARALLIMAMQEPLRVACAREIQKSIRDSVYQLLADLIRSHGLDDVYTVQADRIIGKNGSTFTFIGLKHNITGIKSLEGVDILWVEEAENVSAASWEVVIPTIRKPNSEIWVSFNPKNPTDPTWLRFVEGADDRTLVEHVTFADNPFFPDVLEEERKKLLASDPEAYKHVWLGHFDTRHTGYIYANEIAAMRAAGRLTGVPIEVGVPVHTAWDLGSANSTAIWFFQLVGYEPRFVDYYDNNNAGLDHYARIIRERGYDYGTHFLPHDAGHTRMGMVGTISDQLRVMGLANQILPVSSVNHGIELVRTLLGKAWIDKARCADGVHALINYKYEWDENRNMFKPTPLHDWSSDAADGMRYAAQAVAILSKVIGAPTAVRSVGGGTKTTSRFNNRRVGR